MTEPDGYFHKMSITGKGINTDIEVHRTCTGIETIKTSHHEM